MPATYPFDTASWQRSRIVAAGQVFFLDDSGTSDADSSVSGSLARPFSTGAYAVSACTASAGDVIVVGPGHSESVATLLALTTKARVTFMLPHLGLEWTMSSVSGSLDGPAPERVVSRATATLPQSTTGTIFTVTAGPVLVKEIFGIVTTAVQAQATTIALTTTATGLSATTISGNTSDLNSAAVGTYVSITGTLASQVTLSGNETHIGQATPIVVGPGTIRITTGASSTGSLAWYCRYQALVPGAYLLAA